jgi:hypothetical protein
VEKWIFLFTWSVVSDNVIQFKMFKKAKRNNYNESLLDLGLVLFQQLEGLHVHPFHANQLDSGFW